ncbi:MAG: hypothetical protein LBR10_09865 [Prevotellaceae bacterium]|jgi:hypothetical protein|nr:hypothetical protein [Prevotellaceae bacterium]
MKKKKFELFEFNGLTYLRRNVFPRFTGLVTGFSLSDVHIIDECTPAHLQKAILKAGEYLRKGIKWEKRINDAR